MHVGYVICSVAPVDSGDTSSHPAAPTAIVDLGRRKQVTSVAKEKLLMNHVELLIITYVKDCSSIYVFFKNGAKMSQKCHGKKNKLTSCHDCVTLFEFLHAPAHIPELWIEFESLL